MDENTKKESVKKESVKKESVKKESTKKTSTKAAAKKEAPIDSEAVKIKELALKMAKALSDKKAFNISLISVEHLTTVADYFLIASAGNTTQVRALYDTLDDEMTKIGVECRRREGVQEARWIAMDYGSVLVHIFLNEVREFYQLERLWVDGANLLTIE